MYIRPPNAEERASGEPAVTQFGRMCAKLGIRIIAASSPQAKGRVERAHGTHQDRLVKKLRLVGTTNYEQANAYLETRYLAEHNRRYAHAAASPADYHRRRPTARQLEDVYKRQGHKLVATAKDLLLDLGNPVLVTAGDSVQVNLSAMHKKSA